MLTKLQKLILQHVNLVVLAYKRAREAGTLCGLEYLKSGITGIFYYKREAGMAVCQSFSADCD